ncbi:UNVERIFIED_CONTAM: hypothetical protein Slati_2450300 [Sesamum latifolium]|uniref:DUF4283 domain-containing protein n=1 Tax=Sesamum latifolium TaxID=2727402 RepID=A0AAW2WDD7_9LAMI
MQIRVSSFGNPIVPVSVERGTQAPDAAGLTGETPLMHLPPIGVGEEAIGNSPLLTFSADPEAIGGESRMPVAAGQTVVPTVHHLPTSNLGGSTTAPRQQPTAPAAFILAAATTPTTPIFVGNVPLNPNSFFFDTIAAAFYNSSRKTLSYVPPAVQNGEIVVRPTLDAIRNGAQRWSTTAVGYFLGKRPYFHHVNEYVHSVWPMVREVKATSNGFFFFEFKTVAAMEEVIEGGPWLFHRQAIVLQKWEPGMILRKLQHQQVPVWIKLRHLPVELWTNEGLSTVASGIGKPLYPDAITRACTRLDFARVCIMLDIGSKLPKHIVIMVPHEDGSESACKVDVEYEWLPPKCTACMSLGHSTKECTATKPRQPPVSVYVQKLRVCPRGPEREPHIPTASVIHESSIGSSRASEDRADKSKAIVLYNAFEVLMEPDCAISKGPTSSPTSQPDD